MLDREDAERRPARAGSAILRARDRARITLALVPVMMGVQDGVNLRDTDLAEQVQNMT